MSYFTLRVLLALFYIVLKDANGLQLLPWYFKLFHKTEHWYKKDGLIAFRFDFGN